jgi:hypothetical protein
VYDPAVGMSMSTPDAGGFGDTRESIFRIEAFLLRNVVATSINMLRARDWPEFRYGNGGQKALDDDHCEAVRAYEQWLSDGEDNVK